MHPIHRLGCPFVSSQSVVEPSHPAGDFANSLPGCRNQQLPTARLQAFKSNVVFTKRGLESVDRFHLASPLEVGQSQALLMIHSPGFAKAALQRLAGFRMFSCVPGGSAQSDESL